MSNETVQLIRKKTGNPQHGRTYYLGSPIHVKRGDAVQLARQFRAIVDVARNEFPAATGLTWTFLKHGHFRDVTFGVKVHVPANVVFAPSRLFSWAWHGLPHGESVPPPLPGNDGPQ